MKKKSLIFTVLVFSLVSYVAWAKLTAPSGDQRVKYIPSIKECFQGSGSVSWRYCIHKPASGSTNGNIAYLLHGRNLDENTWNDDTFYTAMIQQYWQTHQIVPPTVVTVSFGSVWLLSQKGKKEKSGLLDFFVNHVISEVESKAGKPNSRIVFGESMGGLNALELGLKGSNLFQKVASMCPAVYKLSPFSSLNDVQEFLKRTGADPKLMFGVIQLAKEFIADESEWDSFSPIELVEKVDPSVSPEFYLSCGLYDTYGNYEGNEIFASRAQARGLKLQWRPEYGGHCATDITSLAEFIGR